MWNPTSQKTTDDNSAPPGNLNATKLQCGALVQVSRYYLRRLLGQRPTSLADVAYRTFSLEPGGRIPAVRPIIWPEHVSRMREAAIGMDMDTLLRNVHRDFFDFGSIDIHQIREAWLVDGALYLQRYRVQLAWPPSGIWHTRPGKPCGEIRDAALASTLTGSRWFGHWIWDEVPLQVLTSAYGLPVSHARAPYFHESGIRQAIGVDEPRRLGTARLHNLTLAADPPVSPGKTRRLLAMRSRLASLPHGHNRIFLLRGQGGERRDLANESDLIDRLGRAGFVAFSPAGKPFEEVLRICNGAETLVTVEGSHATPAWLFMRTGGRLIVLNPPHRSSTILPDLGLFVGLRGGMFICDPLGQSTDAFTAEPDEVLRFVDHVEAVSTTGAAELEAFTERLLRHH